MSIDYRRLKTSKGRFPIEEMALRNSDSGLAEIAFSFPGEPMEVGAEIDLETLACTLPTAGDVQQSMAIERLGECAKTTGPLLGNPRSESLLDWTCEIRIAQAALVLQQAVNGSASLDAASAFVAKSEVKGADDLAFTTYCVSLAVGLTGETRLESLFPAMPWMKRFEEGDSRDYAFVRCDGEDERVMDVHLISFANEIPASDYSLMAGYFNGMGFSLEGAGEEIEHARIAVCSSSRRSPLDDSDKPHLQRLVHALVTLHTEGVHVDLFKSNGSRDFLAFDSYLSWLWYDFAMRLGAVKVGYCVQCGRGFSLTGHRGMDKEYCSEACRTQAKNERRRLQTAEMRRLFKSGQSVTEVAKAVHPDMPLPAAERAVRSALMRWPELKRAVEEDLKCGDGKLVRRCLEQGAVDPDFVARKARAISRRRRA